MHIYRGRHNVHVTPSPADFRTSVGMCGYISDVRRAGFLLRDGTYTTNTTEFSENWYVRASRAVTDIVMHHSHVLVVVVGAGGGAGFGASVVQW